MALNTKDKLVDEFVSGVIARNSLHANFINSSLTNMSLPTRQKLDDYLTYCVTSGVTIEELVGSYNTVTVEAQIELLYFRKHKAYRWSKFSEVAKNVYFNKPYMRKYMYGLALTSFLWPNHAAMHNFFIQTFPDGATGTYLEVGPGHGYYFMEASRMGNFTSLIGVDISASSIAMTRDIVRHFSIEKRSEVDLIEADFLDFDASHEPYSCIVMGEVLEHVEEPALFLSRLAQISTPKTHIYMTTCVNAPAVDHIFLFRHPDEIEEMAMKCGLSVKEKLYAPYGKLTIEDSISQALPVNVAYVFKKT